MTRLPPLQHICFHKDYDGLVAAAMVASACEGAPMFEPVQYHPELRWTERTLPPGTAIVDFLYHPDAALWIDHHATTFDSKAQHAAFKSDPLHVFEPDAPSCPSIIVRLPWFRREARWEPYLQWSNIIDSAAYASPEQANQLDNPHILLSFLIGATDDLALLRSLILGVRDHDVEQVLAMAPHAEAAERVLFEERGVRDRLWSRVRLDGHVVLMDQSDLPIAYRRYLPYQRFPSARYGIGCYRSDKAVIVSVGENPWGPPGPVHLGELCRGFGGGGRKATAGVPVADAKRARALAQQLSTSLNKALQNEVSPYLSHAG